MPSNCLSAAPCSGTNSHGGDCRRGRSAARHCIRAAPLAVCRTRARPAGLVAGQLRLGQRPGEKGGELTGPIQPAGPDAARSITCSSMRAGCRSTSPSPRRPQRQHARRTDPGFHVGDQGRRPRPHPRRRPIKLHADKGNDVPRVRRYLRRRGIAARIARIGRDSSARLGRHRWVVERTLG